MSKHNQHHHALPGPRIRLLASTLALCLIGLGGSFAATASEAGAPSGSGEVAMRPDARSVYPDVTAAVEGAMQAARERSAYRRGHVLFGTVRAVVGGFTFSEPKASHESLTSARRFRIRLRLTEQDVASYVVRPRSGNRRVDRLNEKLTRSERRFVDEVDVRHRPLFVLTPSLRIVQHEAERGLHVAERRCCKKRRAY